MLTRDPVATEPLFAALSNPVASKVSAMPISQATLVSHLNQVVLLEQKQAQRARKLMLVARQDLFDQLQNNPTLLEEQNTRKLIQQLNASLALVEARAEDALDVEEVLRTGAIQGKRLVIDEAEIPRGSEAFNLDPQVNLFTIQQAKTRTASLIRDVTSETRGRFIQQLRVSRASGEGTQEAIDRLLGQGLKGANGRDGVFRRATWRAEAIARTESNGLISEGKLVAYGAYNKNFPGLKVRKRWDNIGDQRTSDVCASLIGQVRELDEEFVSGFGSWMAPPAHPFCRSTLIPVTERYRKSDQATSQVNNLGAPLPPEIVEGLDQEESDIFRNLRTEFESNDRSTVILGNGLTYEETIEQQGAQKANAERDKLLKIVARRRAATNRASRTGGETTRSTSESRSLESEELMAYQRLYPNSNLPLYLWKRENPELAASLLEKFAEEKRLDEQFQLPSVLEKGRQVTETLRKKLNEAQDSVDRILAFDEFRNSLMTRNPGLDVAKLTENLVVEQGILDSQIPELEAKVQEVFRLTNGAGSSVLKRFVNDDPRPWADPNGTMNIGDMVIPRHIYHEMGHMVEFDNSRVAMAARDWRQSRARSDKPKKLSDLTGNPKYGSSELAFPGNYVHPYLGTFYSDGYTEVTSMALEAFASASNMNTLYSRDEELFNLISGVLSLL